MKRAMREGRVHVVQVGAVASHRPSQQTAVHDADHAATGRLRCANAPMNGMMPSWRQSSDSVGGGVE